MKFYKCDCPHPDHWSTSHTAAAFHLNKTQSGTYHLCNECLKEDHTADLAPDTTSASVQDIIDRYIDSED